MLSVAIDSGRRIAMLEPDAPLSEQDFASASRVIDRWIEQQGNLSGILIHSRSFPGWASLAALSSHLAFVRDHHRKIHRVALVTDSRLAGIAEKLAGHFVQAEIRVFAFSALPQAQDWASAQA